MQAQSSGSHSTDNTLGAEPFSLQLTTALVRRLPFGRYRVMNWLGNRSLRFWTTMPETLGRYRFQCDLRDSIAREVCFTGCYEPQDTALIRQLLGEQMTFVDVGANWGYFTQLAAHLVGDSGRVISLEPDPRLYSLLCRNLQSNDLLGRVTAIEAAAADESANHFMCGFDEQAGNWGLSRLTTTLPTSSTSFMVAARPLDDLLDEQQVSDVDLIKIDIEGAEDLALLGMRRGLASQRYKRIILELHPILLEERGRTVAEALMPLITHGYHGWRIDHSRQADRRAAYCTRPNLADFIQVLDCTAPHGSWPHHLWLAPEIELQL